MLESKVEGGKIISGSRWKEGMGRRGDVGENGGVQDQVWGGMGEMANWP